MKDEGWRKKRKRNNEGKIGKKHWQKHHRHAKSPQRFRDNKINRLHKHQSHKISTCSIASIPLRSKIRLHNLSLFPFNRKLRKQCDMVTWEVIVGEPGHSA